ncbi:site-2 protease family protein [Crossiella sp. CA-258035]|uniref:M50 family metallopeptidase n=1 Tax=Crossiella sp. CA-258035 TaxID=2981138 RepID=UPI0024BC91E2|nr:site-2 protease family protein [Crossiella sp. CA-258035]WHT17996.1 site-2 protease family protein [Crossiella sp. CA-258035]
MMFVLGVLILVFGILFSIAWHELGHLSTAKLFGVKVTQYMVGFGRTLWSRRIGETEYGIKALPFGGYIRMIGMLPPVGGGNLGRNRSTGMFSSMVDDARSASAEEVRPEDVDRQFYQRRPWKRIIVMFAGPFMNLILAVVLFSISLMGFGREMPTTTVASVSKCALPASQQAAKECPADAPAAPAAAAGFKAGDKLVSFNGKPAESWDAVRAEIRAAAGKEVPVVVDRGGQQVTLTPKLIATEMPDLDDPKKVSTVGFLGLSPTSEVQTLGVTGVAHEIGGLLGKAATAIVQLPERVPALVSAVFGGERERNSPVGIVGVARIGGEIAALDIPGSVRIAAMINILAALNLSLFLFNMLPMLPLDGGHIAGALYESIRRRFAKLRRRPDPGPFDVAKLMPLAYAISLVIIAYGALVLVADVINPVRLG